jgi:hypothetical protein
MKPRVYIETTIPSYLTAFPSRDIVICAHQQLTKEWWLESKAKFETFISEAVMEEIRQGDVSASEKRMSMISGLTVLSLNDDVRELVHFYDSKLGLPKKAKTDILHIAFAVSYEMDYMLTWNCAHLANGGVMRKLLDLNGFINRYTPLIVTPEELLTQ